MTSSILVLAQIPPPLHGQAIMSLYFLTGEYDAIQIVHDRMAFSSTIEDVGEFQWKKLPHLFAVVLKAVWLRFRYGIKVLHFPPASPNTLPFWRDCLILIPLRWLFSKTVFHFHAVGISTLYSQLSAPLRLLYRAAYGQPDLCICLSKLATDDAKQFKAKKVVVIPYGIPDAAYDPLLGRFDSRRAHRDTGKPTILYLATVSVQKGVGVLFEALGTLRRAGQDFRCLIAGPFATKADEDTLLALAGKQGIAGDLIWKGQVSNESKWDCFRDADIFCFPSHYSAEGFPVVLLEAMMFGLPVVSTNWRGIPDIVVDGETGFLVEPHAAIDVANRLQRLLESPELRARMGTAARKRYEENFTLERFRDRMEDALASLHSSPAHDSQQLASC